MLKSDQRCGERQQLRAVGSPRCGGGQGEGKPQGEGGGSAKTREGGGTSQVRSGGGAAQAKGGACGGAVGTAGRPLAGVEGARGRSRR